MGFYEDAKTFGDDLPLGHHFVTAAILENKDGKQFVDEYEKGVKAALRLSDEAGDTVVANLHFNANTGGPIKGALQCFGLEPGMIDGLMGPTDMANITPTTFPIGLAHKILSAICASKGGWVEISPREGYKPEVKFKKNEPKVKKTAADYPVAAAPSGAMT